MRSRRAVGLCAFFGALTCTAAVAPPAARDVAFVRVNVIDMATDAVQRDVTLIVRDGRIATIAPAASANTTGLETIDAQGLFVIPGLAEMHAHVPLPRAEGLPDSYREDVLLLWVANGVTLARGMLGHPSHLELRVALQRHDVLGPRLYTAGPSFNGQTVTEIDEALVRLRDQKSAGYDFAKFHGGLTREQFDAITAEARRIGFPFGGHVSVDVGLLRTLEAGQRTIDHLDGYVHALVPESAGTDSAAVESFFGIGLVTQADEARIDELVQRTRAADAWVVPTETLIENFAAEDVAALAARPEMAYLPRDLLARYRNALEQRASSAPSRDTVRRFLLLRKKLIHALHDVGAGVLLGSDSPQVFNVPGFSIHRELDAMVRAGLSPYEALELGTVNVARFFGDDSPLLEAGDSADFVLLRANPLEDIGATQEIEGVMLRGRWLSRAFLDAALAGIRERMQSGP